MFIRLCDSPDMSYNCWGIRAQWLKGYAPRFEVARRLIDAGEWSANFDGSIEVRHIPGDHFTLLQPPYVEQLAGDLSACLLTAART